MNNYEKEYENPGLPDTGESLQDLEQGVAKISNVDSSQRMFKTAVFEYLLENMRLGSKADDLFPALGIWGKKPFDALPWRNSDAIRPAVDEMDALIASGDAYGFYFDYCHSVPDWQAVLSLGFGGLLKRAVDAEKAYFSSHDESTEKREFFQSVIRAYAAIVKCMRRLAETEERQGAGDAAKAIRQIAEGRPTTFYEAMLQIWFYYQFSEYGDCIQTRCFGTLDQLLYPYFTHDITRGIDEAHFRAVIHNFMEKISAMHYYVGHPMTLGGTNADGSSAINELSFLFLDEYDSMGIYDPKIHIKVNLNTPDSFLDKALDMVRRNHNSIVFIGEPCIRRSMLKAGYTEEEARTAIVKGCYEYTEAHSSVETAPTRLILPTIVVNTLREHPETQDFETFMRHLDARIQRVCETAAKDIDLIEPYLDDRNPCLMLSGVVERALAEGIDGYAKAPLHSHTNIWLAGPATACDCLCAILQFVFEERKTTIPELLKALDANWKGYEKLHAQILASPLKYGNNNPKADELLRRLLSMFTSRLNFRKNARGGFYTTALHAAELFYTHGKTLGATPDGRNAGEEYSKNISPQPGHCKNGITAMMLSALSLDSSDFMADFPLDVTLHPSAVKGDDGLAAMRTLVKTYIKGFGHALHFNVFTTEQLEDAQRHPEKYNELQIRVCGWNVLWNNLTRAEQDAYILQAKVNEC